MFAQLAEIASHHIEFGRLQMALLATPQRRHVPMGGKVTELSDGLRIDPAPLHGGEWPCYADHRMATAGAILGLKVPGIEIEDISTTAKTLPGFDRMWETMLDPEQQESNG